jgi:hypothetical protein
MAILVLCNVGNRDIQVRDRTVAEGLGIALGREPGAPWTIWGAREGGQRLWEHPEAAAGLSFDILDPCLEQVISRHRGPIDRLVLFGTDQPEGLVAERHRQKDTLHFAEVMARHYGGQAASRIRRVAVLQVRGIDAALYDEAFEAYGKLLSDLPQSVEACYLIISGGMPACNAALLLQGVRRWGERARVLYLPEGASEPRELRAGAQILASLQRAVIEAHLQRLDFAAARALMPAIEAPRAVCGLAAYGQQRLDFDFDTAQETLLDEVERHGDLAVRRFVDSVRCDLDPLCGSDESTERLRTLLAELFWNSEIAFEQRRYADFLARVYRFQEAVLRYLVETAYGWPTDLSLRAREGTLQAWKQALAMDDRLRAYLAAKGVDGRSLTERQINRYTFNALLAFALDPKGGQREDGGANVPPDRRQFLQAQIKRVNAFDKLVELRHRTIVGHDFEGVSLSKIRAAYPNGEKDAQGQPDPVKGMMVLLEALQVPVRNNPYRRLAAFIAERLQAV